jgi:hypothetical protein
MQTWTDNEAKTRFGELLEQFATPAHPTLS